MKPIENSSKSFIVNIGYSGIGTVSQLFVSLIVLSFASHSIEKEALGFYLLLVIINQTVATLFDFGLLASYVRFISINFSENRDNFSNSFFKFRLVVSFASVILFIAFSPFISDYKNISNFEGILLLNAVSLFVESLISTNQSILQGYKNFSTVAKSTFFGQLFKLILSIVLIYLHQDIFSIILAHLLGNLVTVIYQYVCLPTNPFLSGSLNPISQLKPVFKFGFPLYINSLLGLLYSRSDIFLLTMFLGTTSVAIYSNAGRIPQMVVRLYESFRLVFFPEVSDVGSFDKGRVKKLVLESLRFVSLITSLFAVIMWLFGREIILIIFGAGYVDSILITQILSIWVCVGLINYTLGIVLIALGYPKKVLYLNILQAIGNVTLNILVIPSYHEIGAAIVLTALVTLLNFPYCYFIAKLINVEIKLLFWYLIRTIIVVTPAILLMTKFPTMFIQYRVLILSITLVFIYLLRMFTVNDAIKVNTIILKITRSTKVTP